MDIFHVQSRFIKDVNNVLVGNKDIYDTFFAFNFI